MEERSLTCNCVLMCYILILIKILKPFLTNAFLMSATEKYFLKKLVMLVKIRLYWLYLIYYTVYLYSRIIICIHS